MANWNTALHLAMARWPDADAPNPAEEALYRGRVDEAIEILKRGLRANSKDEKAYLDLGMALALAGRYQEALGSIRQGFLISQRNISLQLAALSVRAQIKAAANPPSGKRVAMFLSQTFHVAIQKPIFDALGTRHHRLLSRSWIWTKCFDPDVVVVSCDDAGFFRHLLPCATFVYTRHGLVSKNLFSQAVTDCDCICVASETIRDEMEMQGGFEGKQIWATGYSQMDVLFRAPPLGPLLEELSTRKVVLYAPTFNALLSSAYMLGEQLIDLIRGKRSDLTVIIKPHPDLCDKSNYIFHTWRTLAQREPHVYLISRPSANIMPYLRVADLLISDASSVMYAFLALDRPVILVTNPDSRHDPSYDPDGIEWRWRDFGEEITDVKQLPAAVARALDEPQRHARQRAYYRAQLFGDLTDGRAADRIAAHISALT